MPAEWDPHRATWLAWPHHEPDWPGKLGPIPWVYAEIVRILADHEQVEILCHDASVMADARTALDAHAVRADRVRFHVVPTDRVWLRDSAPTGAIDEDGAVVLVNWAFNGWAKYDNFTRDVLVGEAIARLTGLPRVEPRRPGGSERTRPTTDDGRPGPFGPGDRIVLEGGGIDVSGDGLMLVTEEWLLSGVQVRNPGVTREEYERVFAEWLGITRRMARNARFVATDTVVLAVEEDPADENHARSIDNLNRLERASGAEGRPLRVVRLPFPRPVVMNGERLPASYANFYIANGVVIVPTFNDPNDRIALNTIASLMPDRRVIGIHAVDLVWGLGTLHCLTQQEPQPYG